MSFVTETFTAMLTSDLPPTGQSIWHTVRLREPLTEARQGFLAEQGDNWNRALLRGEHKLPIDERVVKSRLRGIGCRGAVKHASRPSPIDRAQAHRTRLTRGVQVATLQLERSQLGASLPYGDDFCVGRWIVGSRDPVGPRGYYSPVLHDQCGKRSAVPGTDVFYSYFNGLAHEVGSHVKLVLFYPHKKRYNESVRDA